ncbi:hypothetical protein FQN60_010699, partial [Etheostoma spectabile]
VDFRNRETFDGCRYSHSWYCFNGNCSGISSNQVGVLDRSSNAPQYNREWCETETVSRRNVPTDRPFKMRVPQNCPRTYRLMSFDPDGDRWTHLLPH